MYEIDYLRQVHILYIILLNIYIDISFMCGHVVRELEWRFKTIPTSDRKICTFDLYFDLNTIPLAN